MTTKFFDKEAQEISQNLFNDLIADDSYRIVGQFKNKRVKLVIEWIGQVDNADTLFRTSYKLFVAKQYDWMPKEETWKESIESGTTFATLKAAEAFYEDFLLRWTKSYIDEEGEMQEVENELAPPEPPKPTYAPTGDYDTMVW